MNADLSMHLHFVWQPGIRRQGDFKRYFRPNKEGGICVISKYMPEMYKEFIHRNITPDKDINVHLHQDTTPLAIYSCTPGNPKDPNVHVIPLALFSPNC